MFQKTLIRLTIQYTVLLVLVFAAFSAGIYEYMEHTFGDDYRGSVITDDIEAGHSGITEAVEDGLDRLQYVLIISNVGLLFILPIISYVLARKALQPVEESFDEQQRFVDDASHELRTPLSVLQGELELALKRKRTTDEYKTAIRTSLEEVMQMNRLVNSLLLMARGSRMEVHQAFEPVVVEHVITRAVDRNKQSYGTKRLQYTTNLTPVTIRGIPTLIEQSVANLLDNATKFSSDHGCITVSLSVEDQKAVIAIADEGIGMDGVELSHALDPFWRAEQARTIKGFGLGLPIVKQIAELHNGTIVLVSNDRGGITARLMLPL
jgi:signal transduction histidine kinase